MTNSYIAEYKPGPNWLDGKPLKEQPLKAHVDYLIRLHRDGKVIMGGPFEDGTGGLVVFEAEDLCAVEKLVASDPAVVEGILAANVKHWERIV